MQLFPGLFLFPCFVASALAQPLSQDESGSSLPIQIGGIVASYVIFDALVVFLLLFVGRRLRRESHAPPNYALEMIASTQKKFVSNSSSNFSVGASPVSDYTVDSQFSSPDKPRGWTMSWSNMNKGGGHHKPRASINSSVATVDEGVVSADRRRAQDEMEYLYAHVMEHDAKKAAASNTSPVTDNEESLCDSSPVVYTQPPASNNPFRDPDREPLSPRQGSTTTSKSRSSSTRLSKLSSHLSLFSPGARSSAGGDYNNNNNNNNSNNSRLKSPSHSIRELPISPPVRSPYYHESQAMPMPLSPRIYNPGPPPTAPLPDSARTPRGFPLQPLTTTTTTTTSTSSPRSTLSARVHATPPPLTINNNSSSTLPFRQQFNPPQSAPHTKTTVLDRPLRGAGAGGPRTGMPTPYSPYMPFTPVTPITPSRLVTRRERKMQSKAGGLKVLREDDLVKSDDDLWGT